MTDLEVRAAEAAKAARCTRCSMPVLESPGALVTGLLRTVGGPGVRHFSLCSYCGDRLLSVLDGSPM